MPSWSSLRDEAQVRDAGRANGHPGFAGMLQEHHLRRRCDRRQLGTPARRGRASAADARRTGRRGFTGHRHGSPVTSRKLRASPESERNHAPGVWSKAAVGAKPTRSQNRQGSDQRRTLNGSGNLGSINPTEWLRRGWIRRNPCRLHTSVFLGSDLSNPLASERS